MDESQIHSILTAGLCFIVVGAVCYIANLVILAVLAVKIKALSEGIAKLFNWFDERPCASHGAMLDGVEKRLDGHETRIANLENEKNRM
jgi:hypothetical protein